MAASAIAMPPSSRTSPWNRTSVGSLGAEPGVAVGAGPPPSRTSGAPWRTAGGTSGSGGEARSASAGGVRVPSSRSEVPPKRTTTAPAASRRTARASTMRCMPRRYLAKGPRGRQQKATLRGVCPADGAAAPRWPPAPRQANPERQIQGPGGHLENVLKAPDVRRSATRSQGCRDAAPPADLLSELARSREDR